MATTRKAATKSTTATASGLSAAEREAVKARAKELKAEARRGDKRAKGEQALLEALAELPPADRELGERLHAMVTDAAPQLLPKTWYGMPAWANEDGKVVCFFQAAAKFESRYATFGFNDTAQLDDGAIWPTAFALTKLSRPALKQLRELVTRAATAPAP